jgi:hypothetical protein
LPYDGLACIVWQTYNLGPIRDNWLVRFCGICLPYRYSL